MTEKTFSWTAGAIFAVVALAHVVRVAFQSAWVVEGYTIPLWVSWVAMLVAGYLAYEGLRLARKSP